MKFFLFLFSTLVVCFLSTESHAQRIGRHDEKWKIIKTEHFDVVVNESQLDLGRYYALTAEKSYHNLKSVFTEMTEKTVIVVNDTTDISNGYATRIPYPTIMVYSVVIGEHDSLAESGNWPQVLLTHELTHILQFEPANGIYKVLRPLFGTIVAPNMLMPSWWKEGMSVETETQLTPTGRTLSTYQNAMLRSFADENKYSLYDLAQANEVLPSWPYGMRPYLFGSIFFSELVHDTKSLKSIDHLTLRQGERVPYFIETPMHELTGSSYESLYNKALYGIEKTARKEIETLSALDFTETKFINPQDQFSYRPTYSTAHRLTAYLSTYKDDTSVKIIDETGQELELKKLPEGTLQSLQFHPKEKKLLYSKIDNVDAHYLLSDLYIYDLEMQKSEQLTYSARARSASFSENGDEIVFISTANGRTEINILNPAIQNVETVIMSNFSDRFESPIFWDEQNLLYVKINEKGEHSLIKFDLTTKTESLVNLNYKQIRFLKKRNNSLYFVSSESGVNNIYVSRDLNSAVPVSHTLTGVWSYDIDLDEETAWASVMTGDGFKVARLKIEPILKPLPQIQNQLKERYNYVDTPHAAAEFAIEDYSSGTYLWPSYWIPFISTSSSSRGVYAQAQTSGHDPLKVHQYAAVLSYDSELNKGNFSGVYVNSSMRHSVKLASVSRSFALGTFSSVVENTSHSISLLPDVFSISKSLALDIGLQAQTTEYTSVSQHWGPYIEAAYVDYSQSIFDISPLKGWGGSIKFEHLIETYDESGFSAEDFDRLQFVLVGFTSRWLPEQHSIKARASGLFTFQNVAGRYGASSSTQFFQQDGVLPQYVARGYSPAQFFGRNIWNVNLEYRFPITKIERGSGTDPYFLKKISGAFVNDGIGADGLGLGEDLKFYALKGNESIWSSGLEFKLETTIGYILPMNFVLGYYVPYSPRFASSSQIGLSLQIGEL